MSTEINCNGLAEHFQPPERGTLRVLIRKEGNDRAAVTQEVTKKANELAEALKKLSPKDEKGGLLDTAPVTFWSTTTLSTRTVWQPDKTATRYESSVTFTSKFRDFDTLSDAVANFGKEKLITLYPVTWSLTDARMAAMVSALRKAAVADASAKARDLADALGKQELECTCITLNNTVAGTPHGQGYAVMRGAVGKAGGAAPPEVSSIEVKPEDVRLSVSLSARFRAS